MAGLGNHIPSEEPIGKLKVSSQFVNPIGMDESDDMEDNQFLIQGLSPRSDDDPFSNRLSKAEMTNLKKYAGQTNGNNLEAD